MHSQLVSFALCLRALRPKLPEGRDYVYTFVGWRHSLAKQPHGSAEGQASWSALGCREASQRDEVPGREGNRVRESRWRAGHTFRQEGQERQQAAPRDVPSLLVKAGEAAQGWA